MDLHDAAVGAVLADFDVLVAEGEDCFLEGVRHGMEIDGGAMSSRSWCSSSGKCCKYRRSVETKIHKRQKMSWMVEPLRICVGWIPREPQD